MKPTFTLLNGRVPFVFVIPPVDLTWESSQAHKPINIIDVGEVVRNGLPNATRISFSGFFPSIKSHFYDPMLNPLPALPCVEYLKYEMAKNTVFKFLVPEWGTYLSCKIESFTESYTDHTGDIYYSITLVEEKSQVSTIVKAVSGLLGRIK